MLIVYIYGSHIDPCPNLTSPTNGVMNCSVGDHGILICSFTCNASYKLTGNETRLCINGNWIGNKTFCNRGNNSTTNLMYVASLICAV